MKRRLWYLVTAAAFWSAACVSGPSTWPIEPGDRVTLRRDEGLLVVHVRSNRPLVSMQISGARAAEDVPEGTHLRLIGVAAGSYRWSDVHLRERWPTPRFRFPDADRLRFRVEPGVINYVGMVDVHRSGEFAVEINSIDRTAMALEELRRRYPDLCAKYPIVYSGSARHVFLERYLAATAQRGRSTDERKSLGADGVAADAITTEALFRLPELHRVALNPSGTLIFEQGFISDTQYVTVRNIGNGTTTVVFRFSGTIAVDWVDDDTLIVRADGGDYFRSAIIDLELRDFGVVFVQRDIRVRGWLIDPLPLVRDEVLWADWDGKRSWVYRVPVSELVQPSGNSNRPSLRSRFPIFQRRYVVANLYERVLYWISDERGVPRAALTLADEDPIRVALLYREDGDSRWKEVGNWSAIDPFPIPVGIAPDGHDLLVLSAEGNDTAALRRYRVDPQQLAEVIFANPGADIAGVVHGYQGYEVIAVYWEQAGIRRYHYFDRFDAAQQSWLDQIHADETVHLTSRTADRRLSTILVSGPRNPGQYHLIDAENRNIADLGGVKPWLDPAQLAPVTAIEVTPKHGKAIEAFLTLPRWFTRKRPPLVVMPHGGPIGVQDTRDFNPVVQSLAAEGYAVIQVNYRGSGGRGTGFLEAGMGAWGQGIEDDIEAAIDHVVAARKVDADRVCIFGGSYGGYSALISITRRPQRYRCAAAAAAPTDLLLMSSEFSDAEDGRRVFTRIVGDPDADRENLITISPAYRATEMNVPILLIYGDQDRRVDLEHAYRMRAMLEAHGKPYEWMLLEGAGHEPTPDQWEQMMRRVHGFLEKHLDAP